MDPAEVTARLNALKNNLFFLGHFFDAADVEFDAFLGVIDEFVKEPVPQYVDVLRGLHHPRVAYPSDMATQAPVAITPLAAVDEDAYVDTIANTGVLERRDDGVAILLNLEEVFELAVIDRELAAAGTNSHAGDRGFAATGSEGVDDFFCCGHGEGFRV